MSANRTLLPYGRQTIEDDDIAAVAASLRDDFLTTGPKVEEFERGFSRATGANHAVACSSGTAALHLAVLSLNLGQGDAAIVPALTFLATANVVRMTGAEVIFADVDPDTGLMAPHTLRAAIDRAEAYGMRPKVALPVHLCGQVCDMAGLAAVAGPDGIALIEDACHALGVANVGATELSHAACFSTHPVKAITTCEGGVVTTAHAAAAARMRRLRNHGMSREPDDFENLDLAFEGHAVNPWYYEMAEIGWNYRLPDVLCALGISQLNKLDRFWHRRQAIARLYDRLLAPLAPVLRGVPHNDRPHGWHLYVVLIDFKALSTTRAQFMQRLRDRGIGAQVHYIPVHYQPYYRRRYGAIALPGADAFYARCLSLPIFPTMTDKDVHRVTDSISALLADSTQDGR
jgi:UDP-4-amino-4,6-dideoxy-N-acetyl-beta-L-altrosamine transaminase